MGIGAWPLDFAGGWNSFIAAAIDDVRVWNTARTVQQIQDNREVELVGSESGLVGYWKLNDGTGTNANNEVSGGNDGTLNGGVSWRPYNAFDVYLFNSAGAQIAGDVSWRFEGI
jgi:hypothetical protein